VGEVRRLLIWFVYLALSCFAWTNFLEAKPRLHADRYSRLAEAWAPIFFKAYAPEFNKNTDSFNPVDHPVSLFFDGNEDLRDNSANIFRLSELQIKSALTHIPIYYSVIETESHFYINYFIYHALDMNLQSHAHDTENVWTIIKKNPKAVFGELVGHITNAHGHPMIYLKDSAKQSLWRAKVTGQWSTQFLFSMDRGAELHHLDSPIEYFEEGQVQRLIGFVASRTHAIYKFRSEAWLRGASYGAVYYPKNCQACSSDLKWTFPSTKAFGYEMVSWDNLMRSRNSNEQIFYHTAESAEVKSAAALPEFLVPGFDEELPKVNLFYQAGFKTPYRLNDPANVHRWFESSEESASVSKRYLYNPYRRRSLASKSIWSTW